MGKTVIVCDDAPIIRLMLSDILKPNGFEIVAECENGQQAIEKYKTLMPEKDGIQALIEILNHDKDAKVIMVTAIDQREFLMKAIQAGAADYIIKPFEVDRVVTAFNRATD